jgi:hypothetical protein
MAINFTKVPSHIFVALAAMEREGCTRLDTFIIIESLTDL